MSKEKEITYTPGSLSTLNRIEERFEKLEHRVDEQGETIFIHTRIMGLLQDAVYRDEKTQNSLCRNCPYKKHL